MGNGAEQGLSRRGFLKTITQFGELALAAPLLTGCAPAAADANRPITTATAIPSSASSPRPDIKPSASFSAEPKPTADPTASLSPKPEVKPTFAPGFSPAETIKEPGWLHYKSKTVGYEMDVPITWTVSISDLFVEALSDPDGKRITVGVLTALGSRNEPITLAKLLDVSREALSVKEEDMKISDVIFSGVPGKRIQVDPSTQVRTATNPTLRYVAVVNGYGWIMASNDPTPERIRQIDQVAKTFHVYA